MLFVNAALIGMGIIAPKYQQREAMLERRYEVRRESALRQAAGQTLVEQSGRQADPHAQDRPLVVPLWRLAAALVAIDAAAVAIFCWRSWQRAALKPVEPAGNQT